jgi:DNA-binding response OmpR family regulator
MSGQHVTSAARTAPRILIVEDEPLLSENLRAELMDAGFEVVGIAAKIDKALKLVGETACDLALVDANLAGVSAAPVAAALTARKLPFIVLSGYTRAQLPADLAVAAFVQKPYRIGELLSEIEALLARP